MMPIEHQRYRCREVIGETEAGVEIYGVRTVYVNALSETEARLRATTLLDCPMTLVRAEVESE